MKQVKEQAKEYQPFGEEWRKEMHKNTRKELEAIFDISSAGLSKRAFIEIIRANCIVKQFNKDYPVGSKVLWKNTEFIPATNMTVKEQAFLHHGMPVVHFEERNFISSIEPQFIVIEPPF